MVSPLNPPRTIRFPNQSTSSQQYRPQSLPPNSANFQGAVGGSGSGYGRFGPSSGPGPHYQGYDQNAHQGT